MKKNFKIITVVGTRPEIIRLSRILYRFDNYFDHVLVNTMQNYDKKLNNFFFKDLNIRKPKYNIFHNNKKYLNIIGKNFIEVENIINKEKPDAFFILGDTNSCLTAYVAKRNKVPIFHYEAGNRCYDENVPEEINRKLIDHIADINLTYSDNSKYNLLSEGCPKEFILNIGSPMFEVLNHYKNKISNSKILEKLNLKKNGYVLISTHREENLNQKNYIKNLLQFIKKVKNKTKKKVIISTHPRLKKELNSFKFNDNKSSFIEPLNFTDYNCLQINSYLVFSDSGTINEESSIMGFDAINIRDNHERHEAMEGAVSIMMKIDDKNIMQIIDITKKNKISYQNKINNYFDDNVSKKIVKTILSYTHKVNKKKYFKN